MMDIFEGEDAWLEKLFISVVPWCQEDVTECRFAWLRFYGLPVNVWNEECFRHIEKNVGSLYINLRDNYRLGSINTFHLEGEYAC